MSISGGGENKNTLTAKCVIVIDSIVQSGADSVKA